jgi:hypothetical protein
MDFRHTLYWVTLLVPPLVLCLLNTWFLNWAKIDDNDGRQGNMGQILGQWPRLVAWGRPIGKTMILLAGGGEGRGCVSATPQGHWVSSRQQSLPLPSDWWWLNDQRRPQEKEYENFVSPGNGAYIATVALWPIVQHGRWGWWGRKGDNKWEEEQRRLRGQHRHHSHASAMAIQWNCPIKAGSLGGQQQEKQAADDGAQLEWAVNNS